MTNDNKNDNLFLIDISGFLFRAFYSTPYMSSPDGKPINAIFGLCRMLMSMSNIFKSSYTVAVCDVAKKTFRNNIYSEYKANRPPLPEELIYQMGLLRTTLKSLGLPIAELHNYEADDVIATLATQASQDGVKVTIISSDKDLMQLIDKNICMYDPVKQKIIGRDEVFDKFGVFPEKVTDVQALAGDSTDNIPGVMGIGVKTAAQLINEYKTLDNLLENATHIKQVKRRERLISGKDKAFNFKKTSYTI